MKKPTGVQIQISSEDEWNLAWDTLSRHYNITTNPEERRYVGFCFIKVGHMAGNSRGPLWSSLVGTTRTYETYESWLAFLSVYGEAFTEESPLKKEQPTFNHCEELVLLDRECAMMQIDIETMQETMKKHLTRVAELNKILGIN